MHAADLLDLVWLSALARTGGLKQLAAQIEVETLHVVAALSSEVWAQRLLLRWRHSHSQLILEV